MKGISFMRWTKLRALGFPFNKLERFAWYALSINNYAEEAH